MTDTNDKTPKGGPARPLSLGKGAPVRPGFSGGRPKAVVVQKKKRVLVGAPGAPASAAKTSAPAKPKIDLVAAAAARLGLSKDEYVKRQEAVGKAQAERTAKDDAHKAEEAARQERADADRKALEAKRATEAVEDAKRAIEAERAAHEALAAQQQSEVKQDAGRHNPSPSAAPAAKSALEAAGGRVKRARQQPTKPNRSKNDDQGRRRGKLTIVNALAGEDDRQRSLASMRRARQKEKAARLGGSGGKSKVFREVTIPENITVADLANRMSERTRDVISYLMKQGDMAGADEVLDADTAQLIVEDFGHTVKRVAESDVEDDFLATDVDPEDTLKHRAPVIAVMGHVDHGKTSLLDALRATDVAAGESGGITQHIGAYQLNLKSGESITVLDTPGHAAFSAMRTRGAAAVDIVILVVAADDGVKPQTIESIKYAKAAGTPMIIAINKMDHYDANPQKVETDLLQHEVVTESMSGDVQVVQVSALKKTGLKELAEAIILQAEILDLKANPKRRADGLVIESKIEKGRGSVATVLVKRGTLKPGEVVVAGKYYGKVKAITDERGARLKTAGPSDAVEILGLGGAPAPGEPFAVVRDETKAREITEYRVRKSKKGPEKSSAVATMEEMLSQLKNKQIDEMPILVKGDVQGSVEAIKASVEGLGNEDVRARVIGGGVGGINESDIMLAKTAGAPVLAFNVRANRQAKDLAEREGVEIRYYSIIYNLLDDIKGVLEGMLAPERKETFIGYAEVLEVFHIHKLGNIAGCKITEGKVERGAGVRLLRDDVVIHEGELSTLKRFKDEVKSVTAGMECGMGFEKYHDLKKGDQIECFTVEMLKRVLD